MCYKNCHTGFKTERAAGDDGTEAKWKQRGVKNKWEWWELFNSLDLITGGKTIVMFPTEDNSYPNIYGILCSFYRTNINLWVYYC